MASTGFPPGLVFYKEQTISKALKEILPLFPTTASGHSTLRSGVLLPRSDVQEDFLRSRCEFYRYHQFFNSFSMRKLPLPADLQAYHLNQLLTHSIFSKGLVAILCHNWQVTNVYGDSIPFTFGVEQQWTMYQEIWQFLISRSDELKEDNQFPSFVSDGRGLQSLPVDMYLKHATGDALQIKNTGEAKESFFHGHGNSFSQGIVDDLVDNVPFTKKFVILVGGLPLVGTETNIKDFASVLAEFAVTKDSALWTKQGVLVPDFRWNNSLVYPSSMMLGIVTPPLKSPEKGKRKAIGKRKTKKEGRERDLYRNNSLHAFETILSLMADKKRNGKSMMNSLKKSGSEVPQLLTQISASITGAGLAVMFSVLYKAACGSLPFCTSNVLTSGVGVGLFSLSWAVNRLSNTILYINKNFSQIGFEEEEMMTRVDKSVRNIVFRVAALMAVLMLRFA